MRIIGNEARGKHVGWRFRLRQYLVGLLLLLVAAIPLGASVPDLLEAREDLGVRQPVANEWSTRVFSDGSVGVVLDSHRFKIFDDHGKSISFFNGKDSKSLLDGYHQHPRWTHEGKMAIRGGGIIDLRAGTIE